MKPTDRSLELVVVGLGQAGGNLAAEFARLGYRALALNTAHTDLSSLAPGHRQSSLGAEQRIYVGIDGYDGAGADLNYGRECIHENADRIRSAVASHTEGADIVILCAGLGGGTGSAVSELVKVIKELELPMMTLTTLPNEYESGIAKVNAVRAVSDLVRLNDVGWIFADNTRLSQVYGGVSLDKYFEKINSVIIHPLDALNRLNDRQGFHPIRTLDSEDLRALLLSTGVMNYAEVKLPSLSVETVTEAVRESLQSSSIMPAGFATEEISYMGIVLEAPESVLGGTPFSFFEQLNEQLKDETGGGAIYMGIYRMDKPLEGGAATLRVLSSTQSLPEGIQAIVNDARREGGTLRDKLQRSMSALDLGEIEEFDLFKTSTRVSHGGTRRRTSKPPDFSVPEIGKPPASKAAAPRISLPAAARASAPPSSMESASGDDGDDSPTSDARNGSGMGSLAPVAAPTPIPPAAFHDKEEEESSGVSAPPVDDNDPDRRAEAASYAKLVATFLRTEFDSTKRRVARRLDSARKSEDERTREFAERAIERIAHEGQMDAFEGALGDGASAVKPTPTA